MSFLPLSSSNLHQLATVAGGVALLVGAVVVLTEGGWGYPAQSFSAAVVCADGSCSATTTNLTLTVADGVVSAGASTLLTWSAQNLAFEEQTVFCFGDDAESACGTPFQSFSEVRNTEGGWEVFTVDEEIYAAVGNYDNNNPSRIYKWSEANSCFGDAGGTCGSAFQMFIAGSSNYARGGFTHFSVGTNDYLAQGEYEAQSKFYQWVEDAASESAVQPNTSNWGNYTVFDRTWDLDAGKTVTHLGVYAYYPQTVTLKIGKRNSAGNYDIVVSQAFEHPGGGWADFQLSAPYPVPSSGEYKVGVYDHTGYVGYNSGSYGAAYKTGNTTGTGQSFSEYGVNAPSVRAKYQQNTTTDCFGDGVYCGAPLQTITSGASYVLGGWEHFTIGGSDYLAAGNYYYDSSKIYKWIPSLASEVSQPRTHDGYGNYTVFDRSWSIDNGRTVTHIGAYSTSAQTVTVKIGKRNSVGNYDIVVSQAFSHPGGGWADVALTSPYAVPATGTYLAGNHAAGVVGYNNGGYVRTYASGNKTGNGQTFSEDTSSAPSVRVRYQSSTGRSCAGDGTYCNLPIQNFSSGAQYVRGGFEYFTIDSSHYVAAAGYGDHSKIYRWNPSGSGGLGCFGNASGTCGSALQTFTASTAHYNHGGWTYFQYGSDHYLLAGNYSGDLPELYKWSAANNCFGNASGTCGTPLYQFPSPYYYSYAGFEHFIAGDAHYVAFGDENGANPSKLFAFMPDSNCFGDGTTCGQPFQTFSSPLLYARGGFEHFTVGEDQYLVSGSYGSQNSTVYKLNAVSCFGSGASCGAAAQEVHTSSPSDWGVITIGSDTYAAWAHSGTVRLYKVMEDCIGNGTSCGNSAGSNAHQTLGTNLVPSDAYEIAFINSPSNPQQTFMIVTGNSETRVFRWMDPQ